MAFQSWRKKAKIIWKMQIWIHNVHFSIKGPLRYESWSNIIYSSITEGYTDDPGDTSRQTITSSSTCQTNGQTQTTFKALTNIPCCLSASYFLGYLDHLWGLLRELSNPACVPFHTVPLELSGHPHCPLGSTPSTSCRVPGLCGHLQYCRVFHPEYSDLNK